MQFATRPLIACTAKKISDFLILSEISGRPIIDSSGELS
jgi:hypothetical protein